MARVNYRKTVSDGIIKRVLDKIAALFSRDVRVTSGDRDYVPSGGSATSLHLLKQAADLHVDGMDDWSAFTAIRSNYLDIFEFGHVYELILHGQFTATQGAHIHLGRFADERMEKGVSASLGDGKESIRAKNGVLVRIEGVTKEEKDKETTMEYLQFDPPSAGSAPIAGSGNSAPRTKPARPTKPTATRKPAAPEKNTPPKKPEKPTRGKNPQSSAE